MSILGTLSAIGIGVISIQAPIVIGGAGLILLSGVLTVTMPETWRPAARDATCGHVAHMRRTVREGFRLAKIRPAVRTSIAISLFVGLSSEAFDRLHIAFVLDRFDFPTVFGTDDPVFWFGAAGLIGTALCLIASEIFKRTNPATFAAGTPSRLLAILAVLHVVTTAIFALSGSLWLAFAMLWVRGISGTLTGPVQTAWMNRSLEPGVRATVMSLDNQANAIGQIGGGPALGWVGNSVSIRAALLGSSLLLTPIVALYVRFADRERTVAALGATPVGKT